MCENELCALRLSKVIVWQTDIHTDRQIPSKVYTTPLCGWSVRMRWQRSWQDVLCVVQIWHCGVNGHCSTDAVIVPRSDEPKSTLQCCISCGVHIAVVVSSVERWGRRRPTVPLVTCCQWRHCQLAHCVSHRVVTALSLEVVDSACVFDSDQIIIIKELILFWGQRSKFRVTERPNMVN